MALGTLTLLTASPSSGPNLVLGPLRVVNTTITGDSSYPTGGSSLPAASFGLDAILFTSAEIQNLSGTNSTGVSTVVYNVTTSKLQCFGATSETSNATNLSGVTFNVIAFGY